MAPSIPDRWIPYKACGNVIEGTRIVCFKVPLRRVVQQSNKDIKEIWDIKTLLKTIPKLVAVIDLTNTARYYNPQELQEAGVRYKKIYIPGRIVPPEDCTLEFMNAVDEFAGIDCEALIGVHCTHGVNRTGYMVCRYMRDRLGLDGKEAIKKFELARGYKIERDNYIADLIHEKPLPPDEGSTTELRPISENDGNEIRIDSDNCNRHDNKKLRCNGKSERDKCKDGNYDNECGKYVRHPNYEPYHRHSSGRNGQGGSRKRGYESDPRRSSDRRRRRQSSESDRSDRSYDFRYDY